MSSWTKKLETKLDGLADGASKESIQTLANWIAFNRKHSTIISTVLTQRLHDNSTNPRRQWLYWQVIHEVLITDHGTTAGGKWEKLLALREALGEALIPTMEALASNLPPPDSMDPYMKEWAELSVFGGPSILAQIRRLYQSRNQAAISTDEPPQPSVLEEEEIVSPSIPADLPVKDDNNSKQPVHSGDNTGLSSVTANSTTETTTASKPLEAGAHTSTVLDDNNDEGDASHHSKLPQQKQSSFSHLNNVDVEYDFDSKGVPYGKVESREFLDPCKAITSLQIARDVRTNSAVEISMALSNLPTDILQTAEEMVSGTLLPQQLDATTVNDYSIRIPSNLLDLDIDEELGSLKMFQDIVQRQKMAREKLMYLLLKSRCQFGSTDAARDYHQMDTVVLKKLNKRKQLLSDALELEGLDPSQIVDDEEEKNSSRGKKKKVTTKDEEDLPPLVWYKPEEDDDKVVAAVVVTTDEGNRT